MKKSKTMFDKFLLRLVFVLSVGLLITLILLFLQAGDLFQRRAVEGPEFDVTVVGEADATYQLRLNATEYQTLLFEHLLAAHERFEASGSDADLLAYSGIIAQNFVADFFTFSNKYSRTDVGGLQFIASEVRDYFETAAIDNFYLRFNHLVARYGKENLPQIAWTSITDVRFEMRLIEEENEEALNAWEVPEPEYMRSIVVDVEWEFEASTFPHLDELQTSARFVLLEVENEGVRIFLMELLTEEFVW